MPIMDSRFDWFGAWVDQNLLLTFTAVSAPDPDHLLDVFGATGWHRGAVSWEQAHDIDAPTVRIGTAGGWTYTVEHASTVGGNPATLERLSADGALAVGLCFTQGISTVHVARDGEHLTGFEAAAPDSMRWGSSPHAFDAQIAEAGWTDLGDGRPAAACASFLQLVTGLTLTRAMLEASLPCAALPA